MWNHPRVRRPNKGGGVSAGCLQGEDQTIKFQEDAIATVPNALKENENETEDCRVDDIGQINGKTRGKGQTF